MKKIFLVYLLLAAVTGLVLAWIDTRPHWDDTGVSVVLLFCTAGFWSYISQEKPWAWALSVGLWIPLFNIVLFQNPGSLIALVPAFIGAYIGFIARKQLTRNQVK